MSTCISRHGEYSSHELDASHTCTLCHVLDEDALIAELAALRNANTAYQAQLGQLHAQVSERDAVIRTTAAILHSAVPVITAAREVKAFFDSNSGPASTRLKSLCEAVAVLDAGPQRAPAPPVGVFDWAQSWEEDVVFIGGDSPETAAHVIPQGICDDTQDFLDFVPQAGIARREVRAGRWTIIEPAEAIA